MKNAFIHYLHHLLEEKIQHDNAWENYRWLAEDIVKKWEYSPDNPVFDEVEALCEEARKAIEQRDYDKANDKIDEARELLKSLPGPPIMEDLWPWRFEPFT